MASYDNEYEDTIEGGAGAVDEYFDSTARSAHDKLLFNDDDEEEYDEDDNESEEFSDDEVSKSYDEIYEDYDDFYER